MYRSAFTLALLSATLLVFVSGQGNDTFYYGRFPNDFLWGSATSAYQIEGSLDVDGRGESIWEVYARTPGNIKGNATAAVACDSYMQFEEDIKLLKMTNAKFYKFSAGWPRIQPTGTETVPNAKGIAHYKKMIRRLKEEGIEPAVTLYHWDLPQYLQENEGGWMNESIVDRFATYSRILFRELGPEVKYWFTINEPWIVSLNGHGSGVVAPGIKQPADAPYITGHNQLKAHAKAYHIYDDEFRPAQKGKIGISLNIGWKQPRDPNNPDDVEASNTALQFDLGWFAHPIFTEAGDYPPVMKANVYNRSMAQGYNKSRLPEFTQQEITDLKGTSDYLGLNYYGAGLVHKERKELFPPSIFTDKDVGDSTDPSWIGSGSDWLKVTPWSMRPMLNWIKKEYNNPPVWITENGVSDRNASIKDEHRVYYFKNYINYMLKAIDLDKCDVMGYAAWSLMDNFEWAQGYNEMFGITYVNFSDPARPRVPKDSLRYYAQVVADNGFPSPHSGASRQCQLLSFVSLAILFSALLTHL